MGGSSFWTSRTFYINSLIIALVSRLESTIQSSPLYHHVKPPLTPRAFVMRILPRLTHVVNSASPLTCLVLYKTFTEYWIGNPRSLLSNLSLSLCSSKASSLSFHRLRLVRPEVLLLFDLCLLTELFSFFRILSFQFHDQCDRKKPLLSHGAFCHSD